MTNSEEGASENGVVMINWYLGKYGRAISLEEMEAFTNNLVDVQSFRLACEHFCYNDPKMRSWVVSSPLFSFP